MNDRVRDAMRGLLTDAYGGVASALARALAVEPSTVTRFLAGDTGTSLEVAARVARLVRVPVGVLLGLEQPAPQWSADLRYPNRGLALEAARRSGVPETVLARVAQMSLAHDSDPTPFEWLSTIESIQRLEQFGAGGSAEPAPLPGKPTWRG